MNSQASKADHGLLAAVWLVGGTLATGSFATGQLLPLRLTILVLLGLSVAAIASLRITELSMLSRLFVLLFTLPFSANLGYLFDLEFVWWPTPTSTLLCQNHRLINEMLTVVMVGLFGLMAGIEFTALHVRRSRPFVHGTGAKLDWPTLPLPVVWILLAGAFVLSWLHAPAETIYVAAYASAGAGGGMDQEAGLNAAYLISYLILILLCVDAERERPGSRRKHQKLAATLAVIGYIVLVLQLLRGDRECAGLVAALVMLYVTSPSMDAARSRIKQSFQQMNRFFKLLVPLIGLLLAFLALGSFRNSASQTSTESSGAWELIVEGATQNTWTAVALNNLGAAADYNYGSIEYLYGQTYVDYVLSLPPAFITLAMGYERPMEGDANPATWYFGLIAAGGMHPAVVPFKNFGIWGVIPLMFLFGAFICHCEVRNENGTLNARLMYGCVATSCMLWFWYGDMNMIRTVMGCWILVVMHWFAATTPPRTYRDVSLSGNAARTPSRKPIGVMS